ncbi:MAG: hypothetical protein L0387_05280 [Acidobacteria bacterium]|nr:hypothetical protein [Acidobacteriota bacterium]MCI0718233.1 hypothetical protein [Acidobacteriota bacterium]
MRKTIGSILYVLGGAAGVLAVRLVISCELLASFSKVENLQYDFWSFVFVTDGHHRAYPNGYIVHLLRDLFLLVWGFLIIRLGREQFTFKKKTRTEKIEMVACPGCNKKTYADAYCRFCGFNLITHKPARQERAPLPFWQLSVLAYSGVSVLLLIVNLLLKV